MIQKADPSSRPSAEIAFGADVGATLAKLAIRDTAGNTSFELAPAAELDPLAKRMRAAGSARIGLTGGGAPELATLLGLDTEPVVEFEAWSVGARAMLGELGIDCDAFLLISLGTGTSAILVRGDTATRVGGTALGGGTLMGLGATLTGVSRFEDFAALARDGDRRRVDLLVSDIYREGWGELPGGLNAASFGKLARPREPKAAAPDLAHAVTGLVGENVALICCGLAAAAGVKQIVFGGSTLRENPSLAEILVLLCAAAGREAVMLRQGEFTGALGALELARHPATR